jgi:hypothetical protein
VICELRFVSVKVNTNHQSPIANGECRVIVVAVALVVIVALSMLGAAGRWIDASADRHDTQMDQ